MHRKVRDIYRLIMIFFTLSMVFVAGMELLAQVEYYPHNVEFSADHEALAFPPGVRAIKFDTLFGKGETGDAASWRYFGNLKMDSLVFEDSTIPITDSNQIRDVHISPELIEVFETVNIYLVLPSFFRLGAKDTIVWDSITEQWKHLPDLSRFWEIRYASGISIDSVSSLLRRLPAIGFAKGIEIPQTDSGGF